MAPLYDAVGQRPEPAGEVARTGETPRTICTQRDINSFLQFQLFWSGRSTNSMPIALSS